MLVSGVLGRLVSVAGVGITNSGLLCSHSAPDAMLSKPAKIYLTMLV